MARSKPEPTPEEIEAIAAWNIRAERACEDIYKIAPDKKPVPGWLEGNVRSYWCYECCTHELRPDRTSTVTKASRCSSLSETGSTKQLRRCARAIRYGACTRLRRSRSSRTNKLRTLAHVFARKHGRIVLQGKVARSANMTSDAAAGSTPYRCGAWISAAHPLTPREAFAGFWPTRGKPNPSALWGAGGFFALQGGELDNRDRTPRLYNTQLLDCVELDGEGFPIVGPCGFIPDTMVSFAQACTIRRQWQERTAVHFYLEDYRFERIWNNPERYTPLLREFDAVVQPDFSLYTNYPTPLQRWNKYRSQLLAAYWQAEGLTVIPCMKWAGRDSYGFAFRAQPKGSVYALSAKGTQADATARALFKAGYSEAVKRLEPSTVLLFGDMPECDFGETPVIRYVDERLERQREHGRKRGARSDCK